MVKFSVCLKQAYGLSELGRMGGDDASPLFCNLVVRFTLPERKPQVQVKNQKEFVLVTPTGEVKTLKVE